MYNDYLYNSTLYNDNILVSYLEVVYNLQPTSSLSISYNLLHYTYSNLDIVYDYLLQSDLDIVYSLLPSPSNNLSVIYTYSSSSDEELMIAEPFPIVYNYEPVFVGDPLAVVYSFMPQSNLDIVYHYDYDNYISSDLNIVYNLYEQAALNLDIVYDYSAYSRVSSYFDLVYAFNSQQLVQPSSVPAADNFIPYGGYAPEWGLAYEDYDESDTYNGTTITPKTRTVPDAYVSSLDFATQITVINNECATVSAHRMISLTPSELQNMAYESDRLAQVNNPPSAVLKDILGHPLIYVYRSPGDLSNIRDIKIDVSVINRDGTTLPNMQKAVYVYYKAMGKRQLEYYEGTYAEVADQINEYSKVMYAELADVMNDKLASTRNVILKNNNNSAHMSLWKGLGVLQCLIRSRFEEYANGFYTRIAGLPFLRRLAEKLHTNQWFYLKWKRVAGQLSKQIEDSTATRTLNLDSDFFIAITEDTFNNFTDNGVGLDRVRPRKEWAAIKVDEELMYYDWIGEKDDVCSGGTPLVLWPNRNPNVCPTNFTYYGDGSVDYVMRIVQRGAQETEIVDHRKGATILYVPTDLGTFGNDTRLLARTTKEPDSEFRERLRLYEGEKATKPTFRLVFDSLERIIPGSTIDFWDMADMGSWSPDRPVVIDKQVGWDLGLPTRTELGQTTYLSHRIYSQGYWEWVDGGPQLDYPGQIQGRYPFFVRADKWWFDEALLQEVVMRFKSAGTSPNYMINKEVIACDTVIEIEDQPSVAPVRRIVNDNWFENGSFNDGIYVDLLSQNVDGYPTSWHLGLYDAGFTETDWTSYYAPTYVENGTVGSEYFGGYPTFALNLNNTGSDQLAIYQQLNQTDYYDTAFGETSLPLGWYMAQFLVRKTDKSPLTGSDIESFVLKSGTLQTVTPVLFVPSADGWYYACYAFEVTDSGNDYRVGLLLNTVDVEIGTAKLLTGLNTALSAGMTLTQQTCTLDDPTLYNAGFALIDAEFVKFTSAYDDQIALIERDYGGTAAIHSLGDDFTMIGVFPTHSLQTLSMNYDLTKERVYSTLDMTYKLIA